MIQTLFLAAVVALAVPSRAEILPCEKNAELDAKKFSLWITEAVNPDSVPKTAELHFVVCYRKDRPDGKMAETRLYLDPATNIGIRTRTVFDATSVDLMMRSDPQRLTVAAELGTWSNHKVFYKGFGVDKAQIVDYRVGGKKIVTNVIVIPQL